MVYVFIVNVSLCICLCVVLEKENVNALHHGRLVQNMAVNLLDSLDAFHLAAL